MRFCYLALGWTSFLFGVAGVALPVVPGVPFLAISAIFLKKAYPKFGKWLRKYPRVQKYVEADVAIPFYVKATISGLMFLSTLYSGMLITQSLALRTLLGGTFLFAGGFILTRPNRVTKTALR